MSERLDRYFVSESVEYLDRLEALLAGGEPPDLEQLLRLCKGVRGSAQMAGADSVAVMAERLEEGIRSVQGRHVVWSEEVRALSLQTVADLKLLVRASSRWGECDEERIRSVMRRWDEVGSTEREPSGGQAAEAEPPGRGASNVPPAAPEIDVAALFYDDAGPHILTSARGNDMSSHPSSTPSRPVPIDSLLLDREGALREALQLRDGLERRIRMVPGAEVELSPIVRELFELLDIAATGLASRE